MSNIKAPHICGTHGYNHMLDGPCPGCWEQWRQGKRASTLAEQVAKAQAIWNSWPKEVRDSIRLEGSSHERRI